MKIILTILISLFLINNLFPQNFSGLNEDKKVDRLERYASKKWRINTCWTFGENESKNIGFLYQVQDSSITLVDVDKYSNSIIDETSIHYNDINILKLRNKNRLRTHFFIGVSVGTLAGISASLLALGDKDKGYGIVSFALIPVGIAIGFGTGMGTGSKRIKIPINGNYDTFSKYKKSLKLISKKK